MLTRGKAISVLIDMLDYHRAEVSNILGVRRQEIVDSGNEFPNRFLEANVKHFLTQPTARWAVATGILGDVTADEIWTNPTWMGAFDHPQVKTWVTNLIGKAEPPPPPAVTTTTSNANLPGPQKSGEEEEAPPPLQEKRDSLFIPNWGTWSGLALDIIKTNPPGADNSARFQNIRIGMETLYALNGIEVYLETDFQLVLAQADLILQNEIKAGQFVREGGASPGSSQPGTGNYNHNYGASSGNPQDPQEPYQLPPWAKYLEGYYSADELQLADEGDVGMQNKILAKLLIMASSDEENRETYQTLVNRLAGDWGIEVTGLGTGEQKPDTGFNSVLKYVVAAAVLGGFGFLASR
jgi:hypothetical protein